MDIEFKNIGKDSHYSVPDGFFEQISELTLRKAKKRDRNHRKIQMALRGFAVAASLSAIALLGYLVTNSEKHEIRQFVKQEQHEVPGLIRPKEDIGKQSPNPRTMKIAEDNAIVLETTPETLSAVLPELTDDELLQMAVVYRTDPFVEESQN